MTYRIFDWNRKDKDGNTRELHTALALDAIDFSKRHDHKVEYYQKPNQRNAMVNSSYFKTDIIPLKGGVSINMDQLDSFVVLMAVDGNNEIIVDNNSYQLPFGSTVLLPACLNSFTIQANNSKVLMITI